MTRYLTKLADRILGTAPVLQPLIRPHSALMATLTGSDMSTQSVPHFEAILESNPSLSETATKTQPALLEPSTDAQEPESSDRPRAHSRPVSLPEPPPATLPQAMNPNVSTRKQPVSSQQLLQSDPPESSDPMIPQRPDKKSASWPPKKKIEVETRKARTQPLHGEVNLREKGRVMAHKGDESPTIRVHIGRIEVRALMPKQTPAAPVPITSSPKLSLDDYLKQRKERVS